MSGAFICVLVGLPFKSLGSVRFFCCWKKKINNSIQ